jgi:hypothetical protein
MSHESGSDAYEYRESIGGIMKTQIRLEADAMTLSTLARF